MQQLPGVELIRVAHPKPIKNTVTGRWVRGPQRILFLSALMLSHDEAIIETERMLCARKAVQDANWAKVAANLHGELLRAYTGKEHTMQAFWNELCRRYQAAGMAQQHIRALIPQPPG